MTSKQTRRGFLTTSAGVTAALRIQAQQRPGVVTVPGAPPPPRNARVTSSVMIWTLRGSLEEKLAKVAEAGVQSVELVTEYLSWTDDDIKKIRAALRSYGLGLDAILASPDWVRRPVSMVNPEHRQAFLKDVGSAIGWSKKLGSPQLILMSGNEQPGMTHEAQYASLVESGKRAADLASAADAMLILENLNSKVNHKGYFLTSARESLKAVKEIDSPHLRMLFDIYHEAVQHGDPIPAVVEAEPYVNVFHVADQPGRHEPGTGDMKWDDIYRAIGKTNYSGIIALEFLPVRGELESLKAAVTQMRQDLNQAGDSGQRTTAPA